MRDWCNITGVCNVNNISESFNTLPLLMRQQEAHQDCNVNVFSVCKGFLGDPANMNSVDLSVSGSGVAATYLSVIQDIECGAFSVEFDVSVKTEINGHMVTVEISEALDR